MKPLHVDSAEKRFGDTTALAGVSLDLDPGELLSLLAAAFMLAARLLARRWEAA